MSGVRDKAFLAGSAITALALVAAGPLAGCASDPKEGYAAQNPFSARYKSVALPIFQNRSFIRDFEFDLADALVKQVSSMTPMRVTGDSTADTILRGTITDISLTELSRDPTTGLANEMLFRVTVDFEWSDLRTGMTIAARNGLSTSALFVPSRPAREPIALGRFEAAQLLARELVDQMQSAW